MGQPATDLEVSPRPLLPWHADYETEGGPRWLTLLDMLRRFDPYFLNSLIVLIRAVDAQDSAREAFEAIEAESHTLGPGFFRIADDGSVVEVILTEAARIALAGLVEGERHALDPSLEAPPPKKPRGISKKSLERSAQLASEHGLPITSKYFLRMQQTRRGRHRLSFSEHLQRLKPIIELELESIRLLHVRADLQRYARAGEVLDNAAAARFPEAIFDAEAAGECLALEKFSACVFHLMRVMEHALRAVHKSLGLPKPQGHERNWGNILRAINGEITRRDLIKPVPPPWKRFREFYSGSYGLLRGVRDAWRNETMHADGKHVEDDAVRILSTVRAYLSHLAQLPKRAVR